MVAAAGGRGEENELTAPSATGASHINGALAVPTAWPSAQVESARARLARSACLRSIKSDPSRRTAPPQTLAAAQSLHKP